MKFLIFQILKKSDLDRNSHKKKEKNHVFFWCSKNVEKLNNFLKKKQNVHSG